MNDSVGDNRQYITGFYLKLAFSDFFTANFRFFTIRGGQLPFPDEEKGRVVEFNHIGLTVLLDLNNGKRGISYPSFLAYGKSITYGFYYFFQGSPLLYHCSDDFDRHFRQNIGFDSAA